ncbi:MAG: DUF2339 domain-containing protein [Opitutales bacterium]
MAFLGLIIVLLLLAAIILPWVNMGRLAGHRNELEQLKRELKALRRERQSTEAPQEAVKPVKPSEAESPKVLAEELPQQVAVSRPEVLEAPKAELAEDPKVEKAVPPSMPVLAKAERKSAPAEVAAAQESEDSQDWFSKVAIWVGSIALLMAGFYMIKYSIDSGLLTPAVRLWLTTGFGILLCLAGLVISIKSALAANERIGQALSGAGVACLYFAAYAAVHMYSFLSAGQGFAAMLAVTLLAVGLSLKHGAPVALMGLVGGFLTPWLMSTGSNDTVMLFSYLFLLFSGAQFLCVRRGWWSLLCVSLVGAYLWSAFVILGNVNGVLNNLEGTMVFVLGICLVNAVWVFLAKPGPLSASAKSLLMAIRLLTWGGGLIQGLVLLLIGGFAAVDMLLFSLLSVGALALAVLREEDFIWAAWLALAAVAAGAFANTDLALWSWLWLPLGLAGLFFAVGHWRGFASEQSLVWRALSLLAACFIAPVLFINREFVVGMSAISDASLWLGMSAASALLIGLAGEHIYWREGDARVAGEYSTFAAILLGFGLWTYLPADYYPHTAAILLIVYAIYWKWREFGRVEIVLSVMGVAWFGWMALHAADAFGYFFREEFHDAPEQDSLAVLGWLLGITCGATVYACFRKQWNESVLSLLNWLLGLFSLLGFVAVYQWLDETHMPEAWSGRLVEGGLSSLFAAGAVAMAAVAGKWRGGVTSAAVLSVLVCVRVVYLHLPDSGAEGESFFFNALFLQLGLPFVAAWCLAYKHAQLERESLRQFYQIAGMALGFVWATFLVQDYFGGSRLIDGHNSSTEIYTYSVVWLLLAILYQVIGLIRNQSAIHVGSLLLLLITVGKVFLVDASELEGLFRVLSFLGLGVALIGIGYFYNKVVFARRSGTEGAE